MLCVFLSCCCYRDGKRMLNYDPSLQVLFLLQQEPREDFQVHKNPELYSQMPPMGENSVCCGLVSQNPLPCMTPVDILHGIWCLDQVHIHICLLVSPMRSAPPEDR